MIPDDPNTRLTRDATAAALTEAGFPISVETLATWASRPPKGGGPAYQLFGPRALYQWGTTLAWAQSRLSLPHRTTSERDAAP